MTAIGTAAMVDPTDPKSVKGVLHNPHSFEMLGSSSITLFNIALPEKGSKLDKPPGATQG